MYAQSIDVQTHGADVFSAVELAQSKVAAKIETSIMQKILKNCQILQIVRSLVVGKEP